MRLKLNWSEEAIIAQLGISSSTFYRVLKQYESTKNPVRKSGKPSGYLQYELPPLSNRKKGEGYSTVEKSAVIALAKVGSSREQIMNVTNMSKNVIPHILKDFAENSDPRTKTVSKPTRNAIIKNPKMLDAICCFIEDHNDLNEIVTAKMVKNFLIENYGANVSKSSVRRLLYSLGFHAIKPKVIPFLTEEHTKLRKKYAEDQLKNSWDNVVFSDECSVVLFRNTKKTWVSTIEPPLIIQPKNPKISIMIWAGIARKGKIIRICDKGLKINKNSYLQIMKETLLPYGKTFYGENWSFVQDNAPSHKAKIVVKYLKENVPGKLLEHPPKSPDMNPIEHIWSILKSEIEIKMPQTREDLLKAIETAWNLISLDTICKTIDHVHNYTLNAVVQANGKWPRTRNIKINAIVPKIPELMELENEKI